MTWTNDALTPVDRLLFHSDVVKLGHFQCEVSNPHFAVTPVLDNDVFVFARNALWFRRGAGQFRFAQKGAVLLHRAGGIVERRQAAEFGDNSYWFGVRPDLFVDLLQRYGLSESSMGDAQGAVVELRYRLARLVIEAEGGCVDPLQVEETVLGLLDTICHARASCERRKAQQRFRRSPRHQRVADSARAYVDEHLCESVALQDIARASAISQFHLCRIFKQQMGMTLHTYRTLQRLGRVVEVMARDERADLTRLALDTGFSSHSHLCRVFRRHLGCSPSHYRPVRVLSRPAF